MPSCCSKMEKSGECVIHCTDCPDSPKLLTANQLKTIHNRAEQYIDQSIQPYGELASIFRRKYQLSYLTSAPTTSATTDNEPLTLHAHHPCYVKFTHSRNLKGRKRPVEETVVSLPEDKGEVS